MQKKTLFVGALWVLLTAPLFWLASCSRGSPDQQRNIALNQRFYDEVVNGNQLQLIDELISADFVDHEQFPRLTPGREGLREFFRMFR